MGIDTAQMAALIKGESYTPPPLAYRRIPARDVLAAALREAYSTGREMIITPHMFAAFSSFKDGLMVQLFKKQGLPAERLGGLFRKLIQTGRPPLATPAQIDLQDSDKMQERVQEIVRIAREEAQKRGAPEVMECHLIIGLLKAPAGSTIAALQTPELGIDLQRILSQAEEQADLEPSP